MSKIGKNYIQFGAFAAAIAIGSRILPLIVPAAEDRANNKPFETFEEFFPFYMSQHADQSCRRLHFIGTSIIVLMSLFEPSILVSGLLAGLIGTAIFSVTTAIPHGLYEMLILFLTFNVSMKIQTGSWKKGLTVLFIGYGFAWVGHFFFEHNKPATFIYPTYSLQGDLKLWYQIFSQKLTF